MVPLAIHGDGVPVQGRMNQSTVDFLTFNFPGSLGKAHKRIPICCLDAQCNAGDQTINAIWEVIKWSLESLGQGKHPTARHDGSEFLPHQDDSRKKGTVGRSWRKGTGRRDLWEGNWWKMEEENCGTRTGGGTGRRKLWERNWRKGTARRELKEGNCGKGTRRRGLDEENCRKGTGGNLYDWFVGLASVQNPRFSS